MRCLAILTHRSISQFASAFRTEIKLENGEPVSHRHTALVSLRGSFQHVKISLAINDSVNVLVAGPDRIFVLAVFTHFIVLANHDHT